MRKILFIQIFLFSILSSYAVNPVVITGTWNRGHDAEVKLFKTEEGRLVEVAGYQLDADKKFGFAFEISREGFYSIGNQFPGATLNKYTFYFKPGDKLSVAVNDSSYALTGTNTPENMAMEKWHNYILSLELRSIYGMTKYGRYNQISSTYVDFFPSLEDFSQKAKSYASATPNKTFDKAFAVYRDLDILKCACWFIQTPRTAHPDKEDFSPYYHNIDIAKLTDKTMPLFNYPSGVGIMRNYCSFWSKIKNVEPDIPATMKGDTAMIKANISEILFNTFLNNEIKNDTLKGAFALDRFEMGGFKSIEQYNLFKDQYGKYMLNQGQQDRLSTMLAKLNKGKKDIDKAMDFSGTDINGKKVSLSDFKGKVVYVDVWATWCGPCRKELPYMKKMEEAYAGNKDMVFLSISVDELKDKQKWSDMVVKDEMKGVQLFAGKGFQSDVTQFYNITAIPRFMLFDKQGNLVSVDAPRPSDSTLKTMLDKYLTK